MLASSRGSFSFELPKLAPATSTLPWADISASPQALDTSKLRLNLFTHESLVSAITISYSDPFDHENGSSLSKETVEDAKKNTRQEFNFGFETMRSPKTGQSIPGTGLDAGHIRSGSPSKTQKEIQSTKYVTAAEFEEQRGRSFPVFGTGMDPLPITRVKSWPKNKPASPKPDGSNPDDIHGSGSGSLQNQHVDQQETETAAQSSADHTMDTNDHVDNNEATDEADFVLNLHNGRTVILDKSAIANPRMLPIRSVEIPGGQKVYLNIDNELLSLSQVNVMVDAAGRDETEDDKIRDPVSIPRSGDSHIIPALVHVNGDLLKGYSSKTLARVGAGGGAGLVTLIDYRAGQYSPAQLILTFHVRNGRQLQSSLKIVLYMGSATNSTRQNVSTNQTEWLRSAFSLSPDDQSLIAGLRDDMTEVKHDLFADLSRFGPEAQEKDIEPAELMVLKCVSVDSVQLTFHRSDICLQWNNIAKVRYCEALENTLKAVFASADPLTFTITTADSPLASEMWTNLTQYSRDEHAFDALISNCNYRYQDLSFATFNLEAQRPSKSVPRAYVFKDPTHRTCALVGGSTDSIMYELQAADKMAKVELSFIVTVSPFSRWKSTEDDLITYGIPADDSPTEMTLFCSISEHYDLPLENKPCVITLKQPEIVRQRPADIEMTEDIHKELSSQIEKIVQAVAEEVKFAYDKKVQQVANMRQETEAQQEKHEDAEAELAHFRADRAFDLFADRLFDYVNRPSAGAQPFLTDLDDEVMRKAITAVYEGCRWLAMHYEDEHADMVVEIGKWIRDNGVPQQATPEPEQTLEVSARRLPLPPGIPGRVAMFSASIPKDDKWASCYKAPPKKTGLPFTPMRTSLKEFCETLSSSRLRKMNIVRGTVKPLVLSTTAKHEASAVQTLNNPGPVNTEAFDHAIHNDLDNEHSSHEYFESIDPLQEEPSRRERREAARKLKSEVAKAMATSYQRSHERHIAAEQSSTDHDATGDNDVDENAAGAPWDDDAAVENIAAGAPWDDDAAVEDTAATEDTTATENTAATEDTATGHKHDGDAEPERVERGQVLYLVNSRKNVADALLRGHKFAPDIKRMRCYSWEKELANIMSTESRGPRQVQFDTVFASAGESALEAYKNKIREETWNDVSPASDPNSVSENAKRNLETYPGRWTQLRQGLTYRDTDPTLWMKNKAEAKKAAVELLDFTIAQAGVVYATPAAIASCASRLVSFMPDMIIIDEAQNLNEAATFIPMAKYPRAPFVLIIGDVNQSTLLSVAAETDEYQDLFGYQHATSFLDRLAKCNKIDFTLMYSHRPFGTAFEIARQLFYRETMSIVHLKHMPMQNWAWLKYIAAFMEVSHVRVPSVMLMPKNSSEVIHGTSFINEENARIVQKLVVQLYQEAPLYNSKDLNDAVMKNEHRPIQRGTILVVTAYAAQKNLLKNMIQEIRPTEAPLALIDVRTIDESPSHQADMVIVDLPRTTSGVFQSKHDRLCISSTRSRAASFFIVAEGGLAGKWAKDLLDAHESNSTVLELRYKSPLTMFCDHCGNHGHVNTPGSPCGTVALCNPCNDAGLPAGHIARNCPVADQHPPASEQAGTYSRDLSELKPVPHPDNQPPSVRYGVSAAAAKHHGKVTKVNKTLGDNKAKPKKRAPFKVRDVHPDGETSAMGKLRETIASQLRFPASDTENRDGSREDAEDGQEDGSGQWNSPDEQDRETEETDGW
ncbi:MFS monocarboxylate transporter [Emericellopsis cladophorae]|uniref:MFS monocarboxylate transporter n=1 Tax=Emericellopsis cladophorae TaxID=2686198 RepID=A0A9Q0BFF2_9HYPO|nr:MFS monocarboxylate transporter [Emericellopsis cladophorae]KAI6783412.1 MFS monocarboxylate transporter [Emericellopsis cladophorae]